MKTVKITNGSVILKEFASRKTTREYNEAMFDGVPLKTSVNEGDVELPEIPMKNMEKAKDLLVLNMIESIELESGAKIPKEGIIKFIDDKISTSDYNKIATECQKFVASDSPEEAEKKS